MKPPFGNGANGAKYPAKNNTKTNKKQNCTTASMKSGGKKK